MRIIKPSVEFFGAVPTDYDNALKFIEMAGRTCYRSEDKVKEGSAEKFVRGLIKAGHLAMVEHSNFVVCIPLGHESLPSTYGGLNLGKYLDCAVSGTTNADRKVCIGGNLTAWANHIREVNHTNTLKAYYDRHLYPLLHAFGDLFNIEYHERDSDWQQCPHNEIPAELHRYSAKFICDRGVSHEVVRHRPCSFAQESTRYVNYGGKDMEFIEPTGYEGWRIHEQAYFKSACRHAEGFYNGMLAEGFKPQQARAVLPNALRTEIVVTADAKEWAHIRKLRTHKSAHPDIVHVMHLMPWGEVG